jgi:hypothetical protein
MQQRLGNAAAAAADQTERLLLPDRVAPLA